MSVLSNVQDTPVDPISWLEEKLNMCGRIVLVFSPLGKTNYETKNEKDPFFIGVNKLVEEKRRNFFSLPNSNKFFAICLDDDVNGCVPDSVLSKKIKCIQIMKKLDWFYECVAGIKLEDVPQDHITTLKSKFNSIKDISEKDDKSKTSRRDNSENLKDVTCLNMEVRKLNGINV